jgi:prepilin-type N-terminal cleavage/methylation domain-containing protein
MLIFFIMIAFGLTAPSLRSPVVRALDEAAPEPARPADVPHRGASDTGFTLVEVLLAMVILSGGMLALESLGIGAARSLTRAETGTQLVSTGTAAMERGQQQVHAQLRAPAVRVSTGESCEAEAGLRVCTRVDTRGSLAGVARGNARVLVTVTTGDSRDAFTLTSYVFDPLLP